MDKVYLVIETENNYESEIISAWHSEAKAHQQREFLQAARKDRWFESAFHVQQLEVRP